jgi:prepilin-type processing-associated H-X9-DG protein
MSNELSTPRILVCPMDTARIETNTFAGLANSNISYFVGVDVTNDSNPQMIISGDCNFEIGGLPVKSGLLQLSTSVSVAWTSARHGSNGNIGLGDGSVQQMNNPRLMSDLGLTGLATNRFAIP